MRAALECSSRRARRARAAAHQRDFHSLQGEADAVGFRTVFVRLTGCPLRCQYCDTDYAFHAGEWRDIDAILEKVGVRRRACVRDRRRAARAAELPDAADAPVRCGLRRVARDQRRDGIDDIDARVSRVVDVKTPGPGNRRATWPRISRGSPRAIR